MDYPPRQQPGLRHTLVLKQVLRVFYKFIQYKSEWNFAASQYNPVLYSRWSWCPVPGAYVAERTRTTLIVHQIKTFSVALFWLVIGWTFVPVLCKSVACLCIVIIRQSLLFSSVWFSMLTVIVCIPYIVFSVNWSKFY